MTALSSSRNGRYPGKARLAMRIGTESRAAVFADGDQIRTGRRRRRAQRASGVEALAGQVAQALDRVRNWVAVSGIDQAFADQLLG
jgi:hypothetical protein